LAVLQNEDPNIAALLTAYSNTNPNPNRDPSPNLNPNAVGWT